MNAATLPPVDCAVPALARAERLAWLFRAILPDELPHPLWQPLACLREAADVGAAAAPMSVAPPWLPAHQPRHTIDRTWLQQQVTTLPALPPAVTLALRVLQAEDSSTQACVDALNIDPALVARLLRLANAAAYGRSGHIGTVHDAITLLGRHTVAAVLTAAAVSASFDGARCRGFDLGAFWRESLACGIAAQTLAGELGVDSGLAFTAGLLHDFGRLVLVLHLPDAVTQAMDCARLHDQPLHLAEHAVLGMDHAEAGALVAQHWRFPPAMVAAMAGHHGAQGAASDPAHQWLVDVVQGADAIVHALDLHHAEDERVPTLAPALWQRLQLTPASCARVLAVTEQGVSSLAGSLAA
jgi:putative nucleotidyltransferase with HDIG domain